jgi:hypothetical protein
MHQQKDAARSQQNNHPFGQFERSNRSQDLEVGAML